MTERERRFERERAAQPELSAVAVYVKTPGGPWEWDSFGTASEVIDRVLQLQREGRDAIGYAGPREKHEPSKPADFLGRD